ncbi:MAG: VOC family protein, partial [Rubrivivax sp.]|nr:VOC family protein [Rubrivivax sp.]
WARHHRNFPGQGQFDVVGFFEQAVRAGYTGPLSLEIFNDVFRESPNRRIAVDAMRSLQWLEAQIHDRLVAAGDAVARQRLQEGRLVALPAMPQCHGLAFIEFAVDDASAQALDVLLGQMGFQRAGRHRSKPVVLYRQGHIHFVVNRLAHALAREHFAAHGPSVCAIGVRVDDAHAACERAVQMQSARFDPAEGPGEHRLPSIVAPGGGIVHFIDAALGDADLFETDFELEHPPGDPTGASPADLETVDHLVLALAPDRVDTWVLFGRAVLGLQAGDSIDVADPYGLIRNFGMADPGRQLRLVLNVSPSQRTRTARAANAKGGVVVQHIALNSRDIFSTVQTLRARGVRLVPISGNYHDDLCSRFDIAPAFVERMRDAGILFDRNADGDFLHAYTEPFHERFLFEIVQRVGGYDAYGTLNAPARMAALAQQRAPTAP